MKDTYYPPTFGQKQFHCIHCGVYSSQRWDKLHIYVGNVTEGSQFQSSYCYHCGKRAFWYLGQMIVPDQSPIEPHHPDLPADCVVEYDEARSIFSKSPRAAAALLRLCIQKLLPHLGESGRNINDDIKSLVAKGLPILVQRALDYCRVVGNNAVHPGELDINDTPEIAQNLFQMINFVVEDRITRPKEIESLYNQLPQGTREAIDKRDQSGSNNQPQRRYISYERRTIA